MENKNGEGGKNNLFKLFSNCVKPQVENNPLHDARELVNRFRENLESRFNIVLNGIDTKHVTVQVHSGYVEADKSSVVSIKVFMKPDSTKYPEGVALQIHNTFYETEHDGDFRGKFKKKTIGNNTIELFRSSFGSIKLTDKSGNLTDQRKYIFK